MFVAWGPELGFLYNDPYAEILGAKHPAAMGARFQDVWGEIWADIAPLIDAALRGEATFHENLPLTMNRHGLDEQTWFTFSYSPVRDESGAVVGMFCACTETTQTVLSERALLELNETLERRVIEASGEREAALIQLHEVQKLETIGQLTGGIAHDFNNLLTPIVGSLDIIRRRLNGDERGERLIAGAQDAAERARILVSRLLTFARRQHLEPRAVDVSAVTRGMEELLARSIGPQVEIKLDLAPDLPPVRVDPNQLELALLNLVVNARDAMPGEGLVTIAADTAAPDEDSEHGLAPGRYVRLCVIDTGSGMDAGTARRAVEPFFSTKGVGKGTGLGLSMVHGLAAQSGGKLQLKSTPGEGTTVTIWLPAADGATLDATRPEEPEAPIAHTRVLSILLVDDEELVRVGTADMLADLGHAVSQAASGVQALELLRRDGIDLMVTDYAMPGMSGAELARAAQALRPELPVLMITGYADLAEGVGRGLPRLPKPFRQADLAARIAELVAGEKTSRPIDPPQRPGVE
jgi:signal transduction histidine kinase/ActR/RegA family two-component response regulator